MEIKSKVGRPKKLGLRFEIKKKISKALENYFNSEEWKHDIQLKNGNNRLKTHLGLLSYIIPKAESIKSQLMGLDENEMKELVEALRMEITNKS